METKSVKKKYQFFIFCGIFALSAILVFCMGYYRKSITAESGKFNLELSSNGEITRSKPAVYDIQIQGIPKKLVQPGKISISTGHGSGVINVGDQPVWLSVKVTGVNGTAKITSSDPIFDENTERCIKPLMPGDELNLNVNLYLASDALDNYLVSKGKIEFADYKSGRELGEVPLKIVNSKPQKSCCAINDAG